MKWSALLLLGVFGMGGCRSSKTEPVGSETPSSNDLDAESEAKLKMATPIPPDEPLRPASAVARWAMWPMPNFPASGLPNPQSYEVNGAGDTVLDRVTGLMWQRAVDQGNVRFSRAFDQCESLELGGYRDWRLPSRIELASILNLAETQPSIDRNAFPATPSEWFWSSSVASESPTAAWYVYFYFGYPKTDEQRSRFRVRCVRTGRRAAFAGPPDAHYELGTEAVRDLGTGLTWQRALDHRTFTFPAALEYCSHLRLQGHKDWRAPSMVELITLVDERTSNPAIDSAAFPETPAEPAWTSSRFGDKSAEAWHVNFSYGNALYGLPKATYRVRCVR